jgi:hypothetical protein
MYAMFPNWKTRYTNVVQNVMDRNWTFFYNVEYYIYLGSRHVPRVEYKLLTLTEQLSSPPIFMRFVLLDLWFSVWFFFHRCLSFCPFSFGLLRFATDEYPLISSNFSQQCICLYMMTMLIQIRETGLGEPWVLHFSQFIFPF